MKSIRINSVKCNKLRKFMNPKVFDIFDKNCFLLFVVNVAIIMLEYLKENNVLRY